MKILEDKGLCGQSHHVSMEMNVYFCETESVVTFQPSPSHKALSVAESLTPFVLYEHVTKLSSHNSMDSYADGASMKQKVRISTFQCFITLQ